ncbi:hypothetical protein Slin14017_G043150 [Septoria linicola]|nr:hypothetical protein Slin14017_G043150 [Septoria linicola]
MADEDATQRVINHIFLPPQLPQSEEKSSSDSALLKITLQALVSLRESLLPELPPVALDNAVALLRNMKAIHTVADGDPDQRSLQSRLESLPNSQMLGVKVGAQNAAVLVTRQGSELVFESFELTPQNLAVTSTKGRLIRDFPGVAVAIDAGLLAQSDFTSTVATTLCTMSQQVVSGMQPTSKKAGAQHDEERDTTDPAVVTEIFFGFLRGLNPSTTSATSISKNMRDEVLWSDAKGPWRRSPMWTMIRVALQLVLTRSPKGSRELYKEVMVYLMSFVLQSAPPTRDDMKFVMSAKIARRMRKLESTTRALPDCVMTSIIHVLDTTSNGLAESWQRIQKQNTKPIHLSQLASLRFEQDTFVTLPALDKHIEAVSSRKPSASSNRYMPSSQLRKLDHDSLPTLPASNSNDSYYATANLHEFEEWVTKRLDKWLTSSHRVDACEKLSVLMKQYYSLASRLYQNNPEMLSSMILIIFELWIACDTKAIEICPLLAEYDPDITTAALQNLILPAFGQMERLSRVEEYLRARVSASTVASRQLFSMEHEGFANKFVAQSSLHKNLLAKIEANAKAARQAKKIELERLVIEYRRLDNLHNQVSCEYITKVIDNWCDPPETEQVHSRNCKKCSYASQRDSLEIKVHEWPIPSDESRARAVVFELRLPPWLGHWRDARSFFLQDVLKGERPRLNPVTSFLLSTNDPHLTGSYFQRAGYHRIDLLSQTKPCINTHYRSKRIATLLTSDICQANGLQYDYYDSLSGTSMGRFTFKDTVAQACTYTLSRAVLQSFVFRPASAPDGPAPNTVIAKQDQCPADMALDEYKELATIPLGRRIQWPNILLQLAMPSVDFKKSDTALTILQCIYQAGPAATTGCLRESHDFLSSNANADQIVQNLTKALQRVKENWESAQALRIFVAIAVRVLSLSSCQSVRHSCLAFLRTARQVAISWVEDLREKACAAVDQKDRTAFIAKSVEVALICISTFDLDDEPIESVLAEDSTLLIQSCIVVQEGEHSEDFCKDRSLDLLAFRQKRLLHRIYQKFTTPRLHVQLDDAIHKSWSSYVPGNCGWHPVSDAAEHWITTNTAGTVDGPSLSVHYNLLDGELLVNGLPLDQPPRAFRETELYSILFAKAAVEVMPCMAPHFQFSSKRTFGDGHAVQLGMNAGELTVRASRDGRVYETIPSSAISGYPDHFVGEYVHWLNLADNTVEFRSKQSPWDTSVSGTWVLSKLEDQSKWQLANAGRRIAGLASATSRHIARVLDAFAEATRIHNIVWSDANGAELHVDIPSIRTGFTLVQGTSSLQSREYSSMVVDCDQSLGTLVGLRSKLLLCPAKQEAPCHGNRMLLIPHSTTVHHARRGEHVEVSVPKGSILRVHAVFIDATLGRLIDNGDIGCKLYLAYLHALTSHCLADPLTQNTGTEQALSILNGAAVHSFERLSPDQVITLTELARLSPGRCTYPRHMQVMQRVSWDSRLSFLSQHGHFVAAVKDVIAQTREAAVFALAVDQELSFPNFDQYDEHLLARDNIRTAAFRISGLGAEDHTGCEDSRYKARDRNLSSSRTAKARAMSSFMFRDGFKHAGPQVVSGQLWQISTSYDRIRGPGIAIDPQHKIKYHADVLSNGHDAAVQNLPAFHRWLSSTDAQARRFSVMVWASTLASTAKLDASVLQIIGLFLKSPSLAAVSAPQETSFTPKAGYGCSFKELRQLIVQHRRPLDACPENNTVRKKNERQGVYNARRNNTWQQASDAVVDEFVKALTTQWPCEVPVTPTGTRQTTYINVGNAMTAVSKKFKTWHDNKRLKEYFTDIENTVASFGIQKNEARTPVRNVLATPAAVVSNSAYISEQNLFDGPPPSLTSTSSSLELAASRQHDAIYSNEPLLKSLVNTLRPSLARSRFGEKYVSGLDDSLNALQSLDGLQSSVETSTIDLESHSNRCEEHMQTVFAQLSAAIDFARGDMPPMHSPRTSPAFFLQQLARNRWKELSSAWKLCIVDYGLALTAYQRAGRLLKLSSHSRTHDLLAELRNSGHKNWNAMDYPESLLIEVESGIMIRDVQEYIAEKMRSPPEGDNAVMQLNMGEGKSSVIVPITAAALAGDTGDQLVRVIVAKPQSKQMAQMLISKLGGLVNRRVYYMPFSRSLKLNEGDARTICSILRKCMSNGGILLVQPEHLLSFQLMALECFITGKQGVGKQLLSAKVQAMLDSARDIVDESDENFSVHFELIYTMGSQCSIELSPDRWVLLQQLLDIIRILAVPILEQLPGSLESHSSCVPGGFPRLRILRQDAEDMLLQRLAQYVCDHGLHGLQIARQPEGTRNAIYTYITKFKLDAAEIGAVEQSVFWTEATRSPLLLLRGFIAGGVVAFTFGQKRWRVNYGLTTVPRDPPTKLAVPYRAKDSPSPRSEFSHPDVVLTLTSLCYYYDGLSDDDLFTTLAHVMDSDQADLEYQAWVKDSHELPNAFQQLQGINLKDRPQCIQGLFPALRHAKSVADYFLSHIVFPKEMKEFPLKLSASGWDMGKSKKLSGGAVTGFSGTNDSRCLLPLDVGHLDLPEQKHTNALVLEHILQPENGVVILQAPDNVQLSDAEHLIRTIIGLQPPVQVILDVGAQILEMNNVQVAKTWLEKHDSSMKAAVFVNDNDEICVIDRNGRVELLRTSSFSNRLGSCLIFLDEAHTRGIDLQLPLHYRAAVTLGAGLTKDRLVQAAMRMRKLGKGQTVVFCISQEIKAKVQAVTSKSMESAITTADVLHWSIVESTKEIRRSMPLWSVQGERFVRQDAFWQGSKADMSTVQAEGFQEKEAQSIDQRYRPCSITAQPNHLLESSDVRLQSIFKRCQEFDDLEFNSSTLQEEQERELSPEIEQERQVQRPPSATPAKHNLHPDVQKFAKLGVYIDGSQAYRPAFRAVQDSTAVENFRISQLDKGSKLLASTDFIQTIVRPRGKFVSDNYQRSVQWLLTNYTQGSNEVDRILVISPFEANQLMQTMNDSHGATLHVYKPRCNSGYATLDDLLLHTVSVKAPPVVPRSRAIQLNLFAGQLYISSHEDYLEICRFLGLSTQAVTQEMADQGWRQDAAGFILRDEKGRIGGESGLSKSPVSFFKVLMSKIRRNGESIVKTHIGGLLEGKPFQEEDFE